MMMCTGSLARGTCQPQVLELDALLFTRKNLIVGFSFRCSPYTAFSFLLGCWQLDATTSVAFFSLSPAPQPSMIVVVDMAIFLHRNVNTHTPSTIKILLNDTKDAMRVKLLNLANTSISLDINDRGYYYYYYLSTVPGTCKVRTYTPPLPSISQVLNTPHVSISAVYNSSDLDSYSGDACMHAYINKYTHTYARIQGIDYYISKNRQVSSLQCDLAAQKYDDVSDGLCRCGKWSYHCRMHIR